MENEMKAMKTFVGRPVTNCLEGLRVLQSCLNLLSKIIYFH